MISQTRSFQFDTGHGHPKKGVLIGPYAAAGVLLGAAAENLKTSLNERSMNRGRATIESSAATTFLPCFISNLLV